VLIVVENLPVPLDRRVWLEATTLVEAGYEVSVISPMGRGWTKPHEVIEGVHIWRHPEPAEAHSGAIASPDSAHLKGAATRGLQARARPLPRHLRHTRRNAVLQRRTMRRAQRPLLKEKR